MSATDKATGKQQNITITASSGLSKEEIEKMKKEAEAHAEEDKKKKEQVEIKNQAEAVIFTIEKMIKESGDKMKAEDKTELEAKLESLKKTKEGEDFAAIQKSMEELNTVAQRIGVSMYQNQPGANSANNQGNAANSAESSNTAKEGDNVVEGEVEDKK